ncbi:MAG TPA: diacylglycerol kinase family protein [Candidatus Acidoferrales bacterium]|nr:diacylglycerol kinase family protein [Candidatus Acidoferrales bacterium]
MTSKPKFLAVVNPAAGGGRCGKLAPAALDRIRAAGIDLEIAQTSRAGEAVEIVRRAFDSGITQFLAVGGDGTSFEIVNGLFPRPKTIASDPAASAAAPPKPALAFLPLGTGNSFLKDFSERGFEHSLASLAQNPRRSCDVICLRHADGELHFINLFSLGFPAEVGELTNRRFKRWGELGYILGVFNRLARLDHAAFPHRLDGSADWDRRPCLFLSFSNSKFTGGKMMIAPKADPSDGKIEYVRWSPVGRLQLLWLFPRLFTGTHIEHPLASRAAADRIELDLAGPVNVMIDGEIKRLHPQSLEILPGALDVIV